MQKTSLKIDNKEIDVNKFLTSILPHGTHRTVIDIPVINYNDLGHLIYSLIGVCQVALNSFSENGELSDFQKQESLGCASNNIATVLGHAKNLLPLAELELLTKIQNFENESN